MKTSRWLWTACAVLFLHRAFALSQLQTIAKSTIEGVVVSAGSGIPISGARVSLGTPPATGGTVSPTAFSAVTDGSGRFAFKDLDAKSYRVFATANGYVSQEYGQRTPYGTGVPVTLSAGQIIRDLMFPLTSTGSISGRVRDSAGQPVAGIAVQLVRSVYNAGGAKSFQVAGTARTDDHGDYRLYWITPSRYFLIGGSAGVTVFGAPASPNQFRESFPSTFYPGTTDISRATSIEVKAGSENTLADLSLSLLSVHRIRGRVSQPSANVTITLITAQPDLNSSLGATPSFANQPQTYNPQDGTFELKDVTAGFHVIRAQSTGSQASGSIQALFGQVALNVTSDMDGIVLMLSPPRPVMGRFVLEGQSASDVELDRVRFQLKQSFDGVLMPNVGGPSPISQPTSSEGLFRIDTVLPGEYRVGITSPNPDLYIKEARFNQIDILNMPMQVGQSESSTIEVLLSAKAGRISGAVQDEKQRPSTNVMVVLVPDQQRERTDLYKTATTDSEGRFSLRGLAPGDYHLFSWEALDPYAYFDPDVLRQYEQKGKFIHIAESDNQSVELRAIPSE